MKRALLLAALLSTACSAPAPNASTTATFLPHGSAIRNKPHATATAAPWSWWRGPMRNGMAVGSNITSSNVASLKLAWVGALGSPGYGTPAIVNGMVVASATRGVRAFDLKTGRRMWEFISPERYFLFSGAAVEGTVVVVSTAWSLENATYGLDLSSGKLLWERQWGSAHAGYGGAFPTQSGRVIVTLSSLDETNDCTNGRVFALSSRTGTTLWQANMARKGDGAGIWAAPNLTRRGIVVTTGNSCGAGFHEGDDPDAIVMLDYETGRKIWSYTARDAINGSNGDLDFGSTPVEAGDKLVAPSKNGKLYAVNETSGKKLWEVAISASNGSPQNGGSISSPAWDGKRLYAGGGSFAADGTGRLAALDKDGKTLWSVQSQLPVQSPPSVVNDVVVVGSAGNVLALDSTTGHQLWHFTTGGRLWAGAAIYGPYVVAESTDGKLYAFNIRS